MDRGIFAEKQKRYIETGEIFFWTATINNRQHLLLKDDYKIVIVNSLSYLSDTGKIDVFAVRTRTRERGNTNNAKKNFKNAIQMTNSKSEIKLRTTEVPDLDYLFQFQLDKEGGYLAAFMPKNPADKTAYLAKYIKLLADPTINNQTIMAGDIIVGSIAKFVIEGDAEITYWIDRNFWGQGIATKALKGFLAIETTRPLFGRVAFDNFGSQKVLEKCGFVKIGTNKGFANARQAEIEEFIYKLV